MLRKFLFVLFLGFLAYKLYPGLKLLGFHVTINNHAPGPCKTLPNINHGSEDMAYLPEDKALITSGLRFLQKNNKIFKDHKAAVFEFDFNKPEAGVKPVTIKNLRDLEESDFHGLATWIDDKTGTIHVFIVNHLDEECVVDIFTYDANARTLSHKKRVGLGDSNFHLLNDVVAVGPFQFYATNYAHTRRSIETILGLRWGSVVFYDGRKSKIATTESYMMPNGVDKSPDGKYIYMAHLGDREIITFTRNSDNTLATKSRTPLYTAADNVVVDPDSGDIWLGCHPMGHKVMHYMEDPTQLSPSQVLRLRVEDGKVADIEEIFADDGRRISASTVALYRKNQLLIGTIATTALHCDIKYLS